MPAANDFLPKREAELNDFSLTFNTKINLQPTAYGLNASQASAYTVLHDAWYSAYRACQENSSRTPSAIVTKNDAKEALISGPGGIRDLAAIIQAFPGTTNTERSDLGLTVPDDEASPTPVPDTAPQLSIISTLGRTVKLRLRDAANPDRRGKPDGVHGALVMMYVGETMPADALEWSLIANTTRTQLDIDFPATIAAGAKVSLTAYWYNTRAQSGPAAAVVNTRVADSVAEAA